MARHGRFGQIGNAYRTPAGSRDVTGVVAAYRPLGFFSGGGRDAAVTRRVARILRREEGWRFRVRRRIDELTVLARDRARVDYDDTEVDALPGKRPTSISSVGGRASPAEPSASATSASAGLRRTAQWRSRSPCGVAHAVSRPRGSTASRTSSAGASSATTVGGSPHLRPHAGASTSGASTSAVPRRAAHRRAEPEKKSCPAEIAERSTAGLAAGRRSNDILGPRAGIPAPRHPRSLFCTPSLVTLEVCSAARSLREGPPPTPARAGRRGGHGVERSERR